MKKMKRFVTTALATTMLLSMTLTVNAATTYDAHSNSTVQAQSIINSRMVAGQRFYYTESGHVDLKIGEERLLFLGSDGWWICKVISFEHLSTIPLSTKGYYQAIRKHSLN